MSVQPAVIPRAIVATGTCEVRDFLAVHLEDRGFAVEIAHRPEYLRTIAAGADLLLAEPRFVRQADIPPDERPCEVVMLAPSPSLEEEAAARELGATAYLALPFADPRALAAMLDASALRARSRREAPAETPEPAPVG